MQLNWATPGVLPTLSLQMALFPDTIFIVRGVGGDGNHCAADAKKVLYSTTLSRGELLVFSVVVSR